MARSVGSAAAQGLESGFRLAMDVSNQREQQRRNDMLDAQRAEDRSLSQARQLRADKGAALKTQADLAGSDIQRAVDAGAAPDRGMVDAYTKTRGALNANLAETSGVNPDEIMRTVNAGTKALTDSGGDMTKFSGEQLRAAVARTGHPIATFQRGPNGEVPPAIQAMQDFAQGMETGNIQSVVKAANIVYAPSLKAGIGEASPHGGKIVGKEIVDLVPDPNGDPQEPRYIPVLKIYVNDGTSAGTKGAPYGATGFYTAPVTEDRSSRNDARVKSIGMKDGMEAFGKTAELAALLDSPEGKAKLQEATSPGFDGDALAAQVARLGFKRKPTKAEEVGLEEAIREKVRQPGRLEVARVKAEETRTTNAEKPQSGAAGTMQAKLDAVDADTGLSAKQREIEKRAIRSGIKPGKYTGDAPAGGGKGGAPGLSKEERADIKEESDALDKKEQRVIALAKLNEPKEPKALGSVEGVNETAVAEHAKKVAKYERDVRSHEQGLKTALEKIGKEQDELTQRRQTRADARTPSLADAKKPGGAPPKKTAAGATVSNW